MDPFIFFIVVQFAIVLLGIVFGRLSVRALPIWDPSFVCLAIHEAGHAVVALSYKRKFVQTAWIRIARPTMGTVITKEYDTSKLSEEDLIRVVAVKFGGHAAERSLVGLIHPAYTDDLDNARVDVEWYVDHGPGQREGINRTVEIERLLGLARDEADRVVRRRRWLLLRITYALVQKNCLVTSELTALHDAYP